MAFELTKKIEKHLVSDAIAWLTTVTPGGRPAPRPVWFLWDGSAITVYSQPNAAKLKHIATNDQVSLHFNSTTPTTRPSGLPRTAPGPSSSER